MESSYWSKGLMSRRAMLRAAAAGGGSLAALSLAGCGSDGSNGSKAKVDKSGLLSEPADTTDKAIAGGILRDFQNSDFLHLDPYTSSVNNMRIHGALAYPRFMKYVPAKYPKVADSSVEGDLMESWELSGDKLQLTFKLRQGVKWDARPPTNNRVIDANDVVWSWKKFAAVNTYAAPFLVYDADKNPTASVESISNPDANTIVMKLHRPDGSLLLGLAASDQFVCLPREADGQFDPKKEIRGHGPWALEEWRPSAFVNWKRNPDYYMKGRPYYDRMERPILTEYAQQLAQFRTGNIHTSLVQLQDIMQMKRDRPQTRLSQEASYFANFGPYLRYGYEGDSPFKDVRVRRAVSASIDREAFLDTLDNLVEFRKDGLEMETAYCSVVPPGWPGFYLDPQNEKEFGASAKYLKYDPAEAKKLLTAAGFNNGFDFDFWHNQDNNYGLQYARSRDVYAGMMAEVGLRPRIKGLPYQQYLDQVLWSYISKRFLSGEAKGYNGMVLAPAGAIRPSIDLQLFGVFHRDGSTFAGLPSDGRGSSVHLGDPKTNDLIERMLVESDRRRQESLVHEFIRYFTEQAYAVPRPGQTKGLNLTWPVIGNEGVWNTVGTPPAPGVPVGPGNAHAESRINWWYDASQPPARA